MYTRKANFFSGEPLPNTFIGGVSAEVSSPAVLVTKLSGVVESDIKSFNVIGDNIEFFINNNYTFLNGFDGNDFTYYIDLDGYVTFANPSNSPNLKYMYVPNSPDGFIGAAGGWSGLNSLSKTIELTGNNFAADGRAGRNFISGSLVERLIIPNRIDFTQSGTGYFYAIDLPNLKRVYLPNLSDFNIRDALSDTNFINCNPNAKFYLNPALDFANRNAILNYGPMPGFLVGDTITVNGLVYTATNYDPITDGEFRVDNVSPSNGVWRFANAMAADTRTGTLGRVEGLVTINGFYFIQVGILGPSGEPTVVLERDTLTPLTFSEGFRQHYFVKSLLDEGYDITFVENIIPVNPPTNLDYSNLTQSSVQLNFDEPIPNSYGTDGYEVWVNTGKIWWTVIAYGEISGSGSTLDLQTIFEEEGTVLGTKVKIRTFDGHFNFSEFSNEISLDIFTPNTFIGGVGSITTLADDFITGTNLLLGDVQSYQVDGDNNVSFYISKSYSFNNTDFLENNDNTTYFIDLDGKCVSASLTSGMLSGDNIRYIYLPAIATISDGRSIGLNSPLVKVKDNFTGNFGGETYDGSTLKKYTTSFSSIVNNNTQFTGLRNLTSIEKLDMKSVTSIDFRTEILGISNFPAWLKNMKSGYILYYNSILGAKDRYSYNVIKTDGNAGQVGDTIEINGLTYTAVSGATTTDGEFEVAVNGGTYLSNLASAINSDTRVGTISNAGINADRTDDLVVYSTITGATANTITISSSDFLITFPNTFVGGTDINPLLTMTRDREGAILIETTSPIPVNPPTNLDYQNLTTDSVELIFDEPIPNANGTDGYEVWVDDGTIYRKLFDYSEITGSGGFVDLLDVFNDVGTIIGTKIKIRTFDGHFNFSEFSNEIILTPINTFINNTFIGGIAPTVGTSTLLANKLTVPETSIYNFSEDGTNIECYVRGEFEIEDNAFRSNSDNCTYIINTDKQLKRIGNGLTLVTDFQLFGSSLITFIYTEGLTRTGRQSTQGVSVSRWYLPNLLESGIRGWIPGVSVRNDFEVYAPNQIFLGNGSFEFATFTNSFYYANPFLQTSNNGGLDAQLADFVSRGGTIVWVLNQTPPDAVSDLTVSNITANSIDLNFTTPNSLNGVMRYDVIIDDGSILSKYQAYQEITSSGDTITGLTSGNTYTVRMYTRDIYANRSILSNEITFTTL